jgi:branched-chain amino acid aminotransferase
MQQAVNINGKITPASDARISVFDRGFLFGDSIYETLRTYHRKPFLIERHLKRLEVSARMLYLKLPMSLDQIATEIYRTVESTDNPECYIRIIVSRGTGKIGLDIQSAESPTLVIVVVPLEPPPLDLYQRGVKISLVKIRRNDVSALNPKIKSSNLLNNVLAYAEAKAHNAFEGILCNMSGNIAEGTGSNIFIAKNGILMTPPPEAGLLEGVTRALTLDLAQSEGIVVREINFTPAEILDGDECFITSTTKEILPVSQIDEKRLMNVPGSVTKKLMGAYRKFVLAQMSA